MSKTLKWIIGLLVFLIFGVFYVYKKAPEIERMVSTKVEQNLRSEGLEHIDYEVDGMEVNLSGQVGSEDEKQRAIKACKVCGGNGVNADNIVVGDINRYSVVSDFTQSNNALKLSGMVPNEESRNAIMEKARSLFGDSVENNLSVESFESPEASIFTNLIENSLGFLKSFTGDSSADVNMERAIYSGTYYDAGLRDQISDRLSSITDGINIELPDVSVLEKLVKVDCQKKINDSLSENKIQFETSSFEINTLSYPLLKALALTLSQCPNYGIRVEGHTDLTGLADKNLELSQSRADSVKSKLVEYGVTSENIKAIGLGQTRPLDRAMNRSAHAKNRRIEIILEGEI